LKLIIKEEPNLQRKQTTGGRVFGTKKQEVEKHYCWISYKIYEAKRLNHWGRWFE